MEGGVFDCDLGRGGLGVCTSSLPIGVGSYAPTTDSVPPSYVAVKVSVVVEEL